MSGDGKRGGAPCVSARAHPRLYRKPQVVGSWGGQRPATLGLVKRSSLLGWLVTAQEDKSGGSPPGGRGGTPGNRPDPWGSPGAAGAIRSDESGKDRPNPACDPRSAPPTPPTAKHARSTQMRSAPNRRAATPEPERCYPDETRFRPALLHTSIAVR